MLLQVTSILLLIAVRLQATNTAGEPTDLANWPSCAQACIPQGLGPPADCGSLSNLTCICQHGTFSAQIASCERLGCSSEEFRDIATLSDRLCAPVGGFGTSLLATLSAIASSTQYSISTTPTIAPGVTGVTEVSSVLATATLAPDLGNPANIETYPTCAQICSNETQSIGKYVGVPSGDLRDVQLLCGPAFRSFTAGCEAATCSPAEYQTTQLLAQQLCGSLYNNNATLSSSVSAAIASATAEAKAATEGKDPTNLANFPPKNAFNKNNYNGCGSSSNLECVCQGVQFNNAINPCETSSCSSTDLITVVYLAEKLCEPVGGILTNPVNYTGSSNMTNGSTSPLPFTGEAAGLQGGGVTLIMSAVGIALGLVIV